MITFAAQTRCVRQVTGVLTSNFYISKEDNQQTYP